MVHDGGTVGGAGAALMVRELCKGAAARPSGNTAWTGVLIRSGHGPAQALVDLVHDVIRLLRCGVLTGKGYVDGVGRFM